MFDSRRKSCLIKIIQGQKEKGSKWDDLEDTREGVTLQQRGPGKESTLSIQD